MKRFILAPSAVLFTWLALNVTPVSAQYAYPFRPPQYGPFYQTQLSPYLNMLRGGDPAANFYAGVLPEFQRRGDRNMIYGQLQQMSVPIPPPPEADPANLYRVLPSTGHPTAFGYPGSYFATPSYLAAPPTSRPLAGGLQQGGGSTSGNRWATPGSTGQSGPTRR